MRVRLASIGIALALAFSPAWAENPVDNPKIDFGGERYRLDFQDDAKLPDGKQGDALAEFTLPGETVDNWTKLFAYYRFPDSGNDPALMTQEVGKAVKEANPDANFALLKDEKNGVAIIDFLTWEPGSDIGEFNVFKYARADFGPGLIAMQYAQRFKVGDMDVNDFRKLRERAVAEMAKADMAPARAYFAQRAKEQLGSARNPAPAAGADR
jgi:hypothetical protein